MKACAIAQYPSDLHRDRFLDRIARLSGAGIDLIQLRAKSLDGRSLYDLAGDCRERIAAPTKFLINGRADVAGAVGADGVHIPSNGLPVEAARRLGHGVVGRSCHDIDECRDAFRGGADYVLLGPVFQPRSKDGVARVAVEDLSIASRLGAVFALGGIHEGRLRILASTGIDGIAGITMFMMDEPVEEIIATVHDL